MDPLLVGSLSQDPPLVARPSWDAPLVPHLYTGSTSGSSFSWDAPLVPHLYTGSTSGGSFSMACTSGAPSLHGIHLWWLFLHRLYFWYRIFIGFTHGGSYFMGSLVVACQDSDVHSWSLFPYPGRSLQFQCIYFYLTSIILYLSNNILILPITLINFHSFLFRLLMLLLELKHVLSISRNFTAHAPSFPLINPGSSSRVCPATSTLITPTLSVQQQQAVTLA